MTEVTVVTSCHPAGWEQYGRRCVETFLKHWPEQYRLLLFAEDFTPDIVDPRLEVIDLLKAVPNLNLVRRRFDGDPVFRGQLNAGYDYRFDLLRFAPKAFAILGAVAHCKTRHLIWLDADVVTKESLPDDFMSQVLPEGFFVSYLGRLGTYPETGFLAFDLHNAATLNFFQTYEVMYLRGEVINLPEWHDAMVFGVVRTILSAQAHLQSHNLSEGLATMHPFVNSILGRYMDHLKGPERKRLGHSFKEDYLSQSANS